MQVHINTQAAPLRLFIDTPLTCPPTVNCPTPSRRAQRVGTWTTHDMFIPCAQVRVVCAVGWPGWRRRLAARQAQQRSHSCPTSLNTQDPVYLADPALYGGCTGIDWFTSNNQPFPGL